MEKSYVEEHLRARYAETDMMGHVYYANYLVWFEMGRTKFLRERGLPYTEVERQGFKFPVVEAHARYKGEVTYDDEITIRVWVEEVKRASFKVAYEIHNHTTGKLTTEGYTWHVCVGPEFKAVTIPDFIRDVLGGPKSVN